MNTALKQLGFDYVFDTCFSADLTIIEEGSELLERLANKGKLPMFTSCSPGWIKFLEHFYPEFIPNLSTVKSPQQIFGALIKSYFAKLKGIITVALMPCTAKKFEADREEMYSFDYKDIDYGITTRELAKMMKECRINLPKLSKSYFDSPFYGESGSGVIFGSTGGVMESAIRTLYSIITGLDNKLIKKELSEFQNNENIRYYEIVINEVQSVPNMLKNIVSSFDFLKGVVLKLGVVHGTANASLVLNNIREKGIFSNCHFIEFMACEGGCLGGGGQPIPTNKEIREKRKNAIYTIDSNSEIKNSYENPTVACIYKDYLQRPLSHISHKYLHTKYIYRDHIYKL
jgi:NADH-quinone oxidoreductase subunit G/[NiFe] hydrogenase diaphorase moiety small subunit